MWVLGPEHSIAARQLLGWDRARLAREAGVNKQLISSFENRRADTRRENLLKIGSAFERAGIEFVPGEPQATEHRLCRDGTLVRLRQQP